MGSYAPLLNITNPSVANPIIGFATPTTNVNASDKYRSLFGKNVCIKKHTTMNTST